MLSWPTSLRCPSLPLMLPVRPPNPQPARVDRLDCRPEGPPQLSVFRYERLPSTNQVVWELLAAGVEPPFAATARYQTAGRGQWGRTWVSEPGGLYLSAIIATPPAPQSDRTAALPLTLAVAWGIAATFQSLNIPVQLKWPNDLLLSNRKLGGILCQQRQRGQQTPAATAIGVGINWANAVPPQAIALNPWLERRARARRNLASERIASLERLLQLTLQGIYRGHNRYQCGNASNLLNSYQELLTTLEQPVTIDGRVGIVRGVASDGRLRIGFLDTGEEILQLPGTVRLGYPRADRT